MAYEWWAGASRILDRAGIEPWEVIEVLHSSHRLPIPTTTDHGLPALTIWGRTDEGRPLIVLIRKLHLTPGQWQIVAAAEMQTQQLHEYQLWEDRQ